MTNKCKLYNNETKHPLITDPNPLIQGIIFYKDLKIDPILHPNKNYSILKKLCTL